MTDSATLLREARLQAGLTARGLADAAGVSVSTVTRIERGEMRPTVPMLDRLLDAAGVDLTLVTSPGMPDAPTLHALRRHRHAICRIVGEHGASHVRVFGSVARGDARPGSDVDLLIDVPPRTGLLAVGAIEDELRDLLPWSVDVITSGSARGRMSHVIEESRAL